MLHRIQTMSPLALFALAVWTGLGLASGLILLALYLTR